MMTFHPNTTQSVRTLAKAEGVDLNALLEILTRQRPAGSKAEQAFCDEFLLSIKGMNEDEYGNFWLQIGEETTTLWSCHTDTVAAKEGLQNLKWKGDVLHLHNGKPGQCLGADDGAGIWLMLEMIKAQKPGLYIFHRDEEIGGLGSSHIAKKQPQMLAGINRAIAFDRMDLGSIITHQRSKRCCSTTFAEALAKELNKTEGFAYETDPTGSFTDTANYDELIPECTNISVGYYKQHGPLEHLDVAHLYKLREALLGIDFEALPTERDPSVTEKLDRGYGYGYGYGYNSWATYQPRPLSNVDSLERAIRDRSHTLARIFDKRGMTASDIEQMALTYWQENSWSTNQPKLVVSEPSEIEEELYLDCFDCSEHTPLMDEFQFEDGDDCPQCGSRNTYVEVVWVEDETDQAGA